ncbi:uncharacterized protein BDR25DRAFT_316044 [Lindgomyces ingoldianus]|uniref:Uncharacterized protein n=1 Tax=Lindgomyces ingoldianus TaxID=673940 RepID=A0ACB6QR65_9PLEO|nr:uncharacterized protein BDR25DRAFT_316044 [Lindgomyces ingoldianus]KAF2468577.1 hypothetical protein BDR25DRAFT_316044 [Lindgomyces ingoldianus]
MLDKMNEPLQERNHLLVEAVATRGRQEGLLLETDFETVKPLYHNVTTTCGFQLGPLEWCPNALAHFRGDLNPKDHPMSGLTPGDEKKRRVAQTWMRAASTPPMQPTAPTPDLNGMPGYLIKPLEAVVVLGAHAVKIRPSLEAIAQMKKLGGSSSDQVESAVKNYLHFQRI